VRASNDFTQEVYKLMHIFDTALEILMTSYPSELIERDNSEGRAL